ncbi:MAG: hypothetical protein KF847_18090 [Pirellulales bacterium]|nr:hypothetical protein [Pirellulales bacterium]
MSATELLERVAEYRDKLIHGTARFVVTSNKMEALPGLEQHARDVTIVFDENDIVAVVKKAPGVVHRSLRLGDAFYCDANPALPGFIESASGSKSPEGRYLLRPTLVGMRLGLFENLYRHESAHDVLRKGLDRSDLTAIQDSLDGEQTWKVEVPMALAGQKFSVWISEMYGDSIVRMEVEPPKENLGRHELLEATGYERHGEYWFPSSIRYRLWQSGRLTIDETTEVTSISFDKPSKGAIGLAAMDLPVGREFVDRRNDNAPSTWNGTELIADEPTGELETGNGTSLPLVINIVVLLAIAALLAKKYLSRASG